MHDYPLENLTTLRVAYVREKALLMTHRPAADGHIVDGRHVNALRQQLTEQGALPDENTLGLGSRLIQLEYEEKQLQEAYGSEHNAKQKKGIRRQLDENAAARKALIEMIAEPRAASRPMRGYEIILGAAFLLEIIIILFAFLSFFSSHGVAEPGTAFVCLLIACAAAILTWVFFRLGIKKLRAEYGSVFCTHKINGYIGLAIACYILMMIFFLCFRALP